MKIIVSPNSFKESISSVEASDIISSGLKKELINDNIINIPIADGGDGSLEVFKKHVKGEIVTIDVFGPSGKKITSKYLLFDQGKSAFIELAESSGLKLVDVDDRNPSKYNSYATGEVINDALKKGVKKIILTLGGSATVDGGIGILLALGVKFYNMKGNELKNDNFLSDIARVDYHEMNFSGIEFVLITDVNNKLLGKNGASFTYARQKGASKLEVKKLEKGLTNFSYLTKKLTNKNPEKIIGGGAAGGIAAFLTIYLTAKIYSGTDFLLKHIQYEEKMKNSDILITGEGKLDRQTLCGKAPLIVAKKAKKHGVLTIAIVASVDYNIYSDLNKVFDLIIPFQKISRQYSISNVKKLLYEISIKVGQIIRLSQKLINKY